MIIIKTPEELVQMSGACQRAGSVRTQLAERVVPGVTTSELDAMAAELIAGTGGVSAFLGYRGYPGYVCISVNEEVVHGIPGPRRIELGDIVSIDVGVSYDGFIGNTATTVMAGVTELDTVRLVETTQRALDAGIGMAREGNRLSDVSHAIEAVAVEAGFSVVREFVGHGIGREMHEDPQIPNFGRPGRGPKLKEGMTLALEPMINRGRSGVTILDDGWTVVTQDRLASAHFEHTIAVTGDGEATVMT